VSAIRCGSTVELAVPTRLRRWWGWFDDQTGTGGRAGKSGEGILGAKAADVGGLAEDLGGGQGWAPDRSTRASPVVAEQSSSQAMKVFVEPISH